MKNHISVWVTTLLLFAFLVEGMQYDYDEYGDYGYDDEDENYDDPTADWEEYEEPEPVQPVFKSSPITITVAVGEPFELPCLIDPPTDGVIVWKFGDVVKAVGEMVMDEEFYVKKVYDGNYLSTLQSKSHYQGEYTCEVGGGPSGPIQLTHRVDILGGLEVITATKGEQVELFCPVPDSDSIQSIWWKKVGGEIPDGKDYQNVESITFESVRRDHGGEYVCEMEDFSGSRTTIARFKLEVDYPPEIEGDDKVINTKFGGSTQLNCKVDASPNATVIWKKDGELVTDISESDYLILEPITKESLGTYQCKAENPLGMDSRQFKVVGMASQAHVWSNSKSPHLTKHTLKWTVNSFSPVTQCKVWVQREGDQDWKEHLTDMVPLINWGSIGSFNGKLQLDNLKGGEKYLVKIASSNSFGFNEPNKTTSFRTKSTGLSSRSSLTSKVANTFKNRVKPTMKRKKSSAIIWSSSESKYMTKHFLKWMVNTDSPISSCNVKVKMEDEVDWTVHEVSLKPLLPGSKINSFVGKLSLKKLKPGTKYQFMIVTKETDGDQEGQQIFSFSTKAQDPSAISLKKRFKVKKFVTNILSKWEDSLKSIIFG